MHVVCLVSLKGGAGKSTVVQSLAVCTAQHDQKTMIVELDPQGTLKNWSKRRESDQPQVHQTLPQSLGDVLDDARQRGVRWVFVDTPGHESAAARAAMESADLILIPCKIQSMKDFDAAKLTISDAQKSNRPAYVVMNQVPPNAGKLVRRRQLQMQQQYNIAVLSRFLSRRADFEYCDERGLSVTEYNPDGAAAEEVARLYDLLLSVFIVQDNRALEVADTAEASDENPEVLDVPCITVSETGVIVEPIEQPVGQPIGQPVEREQISEQEQDVGITRLKYLG